MTPPPPHDDRDPQKLDTITWRERVVTRLAVLEERTSHLKSRIDDVVPHVQQNSDFAEKRRAIEAQDKMLRAAASARNAFYVAAGSVFVSFLGIVLQLLGVL